MHAYGPKCLEIPQGRYSHPNQLPCSSNAHAQEHKFENIRPKKLGHLGPYNTDRKDFYLTVSPKLSSQRL